MFPLEGGVNYEPAPLDSRSPPSPRARADAPKRSPSTTCAADDTHGMLYFPLFNYADGNLDNCSTICTSIRRR